MNETPQERDRRQAQEAAETEGRRFKPVEPGDMTRKEELNRVRGMQEIQDHATGPTNHTSNPMG